MEGLDERGIVCDLVGSAREIDFWTITSVGRRYSIPAERSSTRFAFDALGVGSF